jgi:diacylglycerol kinase (ATP)
MTVHKNQPFIHRLRFALTGLAVAWRNEPNFRLQLGALGLVVILLVLLRIEPLWWALVLMASGLVLTAELFNTALEHLADHLHPETHPRIAVVKDCAAAAVLVAACTAVLVAVALIVHLILRHGAAAL